jgi:hypothetical protein
MKIVEKKVIVPKPQKSSSAADIRETSTESKSQCSIEETVGLEKKTASISSSNNKVTEKAVGVGVAKNTTCKPALENKTVTSKSGKAVIPPSAVMGLKSTQSFASDAALVRAEELVRVESARAAMAQSAFNEANKPPILYLSEDLLRRLQVALAVHLFKSILMILMLLI